MSDWIHIARGIVLQLHDPGIVVWWGYLSCAAVLAALVYLRGRPANGPTVGGFVRFVFPAHEAWRRSWQDVAIFAINTAAYSIAWFSVVQLVMSSTAGVVATALADAFGPVPEPWNGWGARAAFTIAALVVADLAFYVSHRLQHSVGVLWEFHKVHHSAQVLHPFTVARRHPIDAMVETMILAASLGALFGVTGWLGGGALDVLRILGVNALLFVFFLTFNLQHSHVWLSYGALDRVFVSPAIHQLHHSDDPRDAGNYGNIFSIWDTMFGSLVPATGRVSPGVGLGAGKDRHYRSLLSLYLRPFLEVARRLLAAIR